MLIQQQSSSVMNVQQVVIAPYSTGLDIIIFECQIVNFLLPISFNICFGAQKNCLIETVLLSIHRICFC